MREPVDRPSNRRSGPTPSRRDFLGLGAAAAGAAAAGLPHLVEGAMEWTIPPASLRVGQQEIDMESATIADLQALMAAGRLTSRALVIWYLARIDQLDRSGPRVNSILEVNPDALAIADAMDQERAGGRPRGPLHGIPILLKDNIDTADKMMTTAGSLALVGAPPAQDSTTARRLRDAGMVILGKTNLSEWANFRSTRSSSGWSGRGGQCNNPYMLDRNPCGSSSGSAAAVAANFATVSIGTETDGSIVCPANNCGVVGIKPTVGLTSRAGVVPISHTQDTIGPHARTVADAALVLGALTGVDPRDEATAASAGKSFTDYTQFLDRNGLRGARIGVCRNLGFGPSPKADAIIETAINAMRDAGAIIVDPANIPSELSQAGPAETQVLYYEFKHDLNAYLATRTGVPIRTLADAIQFNIDHADQELRYFGQERFLLSQEKGPLTDPDYLKALDTSTRLSGKEGIDAVMDANTLDALVAPTGSPAWVTDLIDGDHFLTSSSGPAARVGYPIVTVPAGYSFDLPVNISFIGRAWSEPTLIKLAYAFEQATRARRPPQFLPTLPVGTGMGRGK